MQTSIQPCSGKIGVIGIRKEDKSKWERRASITPTQVEQLLAKNPNLKFVVEPSAKRIFKDNEYEKAGAVISQDLSECCVVFGVKEVPMEKLLPNKTYVFFSHTIKAQDYNMPLLDDILSKKIRLMDYEKITDADGKRLVAFGKFAGNAGAIDFLYGMGQYFLSRGFSTPFLNISMSYSYKSLAVAKENITKAGELIKQQGIPKEFGPLVFAITSVGRCSQGAKEILDLFPMSVVDPDDLSKVLENKDDPKHLSSIYVTFIETKHMVQPKDKSKSFDKKAYYSSPDSYEPIFHEKYLPYISCIINAMYWDPKYQRLITNEQMKELVEQKKSRLLGVCDITCDFEGSIEFLKKFTVIDHPFFLYNATTGEVEDGIGDDKDWILFHAVDHLPTELAYDSSNYFSEKLGPFIENIALSDTNKPFEEQGLSPEIERAVITWNGELTANFKYIEELRQANEAVTKRARHKRTMKALERSTSFISLKIEGQLFDTKAINKVLDVLDVEGIEFRVLDIDIGRKSGKSHAYIQVVSKDPKLFQKVVEEVFAIADKEQFEVTEA